jgi:hypothetical protein
VARGARLDAALADAVARGLAEPDASADVTGRDAAEKLAILMQAAGCAEARAGSFTVAGIDEAIPEDYEGARALGGVIKPVVLASLDRRAPGAWVGPAFVGRAHLFASLSGVANAVEIASATGETLCFTGPGAGPAVTAATIVDDAAEILGAGRRQPAPRPARTGIGEADLREPPPGGWYLRFDAARASDPLDVDRRLAVHGLAARRTARLGASSVVLTTPAPWAAAVAAARSLDAAGRAAVIFPALDGRARDRR